jgi:hypothetical protein
VTSAQTQSCPAGQTGTPPNCTEPGASAKKKQEEEAAAAKTREEEAAKKRAEEEAARKKAEEAIESETLSDIKKQVIPMGKSAKLVALLKAGGFSFSFNAPTGGTLLILWYEIPKGAHLSAKAQPILVASGKATFAASGAQRVVIKLTSRGKQLLKHAKSIRLTSKGSFTPTGEPAVVALKTFTLKR